MTLVYPLVSTLSCTIFWMNWKHVMQSCPISLRESDLFMVTFLNFLIENFFLKLQLTFFLFSRHQAHICPSNYAKVIMAVNPLVMIIETILPTTHLEIDVNHLAYVLSLNHAMTFLNNAPWMLTIFKIRMMLLITINKTTQIIFNSPKRSRLTPTIWILHN